MRTLDPRRVGARGRLRRRPALGTGSGLAAAALLAVALAGCPDRPEPAAETAGMFRGKNLLFVTIDTLRADRLGAYGAADAGTPRLDALAAAGVRFSDVYAPVPLTLPSHSVMFTGRHPFASGVRVNGIHRLAEAETTLAELFARRGYATSATVSAYVVTRRFGLAQGFDAYEDSLGMDNLFRYFSEVPADETRRRFVSWLDGRPAEKPFFAWVHFYDPHGPYDPPAPFTERHPDDPYQGEIAFVDRELGLLLDQLTARGLDQETVVVVTSDHGEAFGEHGEEGHGLLAYDETLKVPLIVRAPGAIPGGRVIGARVSLYDLFPTLVDLFALEADPSALPGRSLGATLAGGAPPPAPEVYFETLAGMTGKGWAPLTGLIAAESTEKLISVPRPELYDLAADPEERHNLVDERRRRFHQLTARLAELTAGSDPTAAEEHELSDEDRRQLAALGYLSRPALRTTVGLDPKRGIAIEALLRDARHAAESGHADEAARRLAALRADHPDVDMGELYEIEHLVAVLRGDDEAARRSLAEGVGRFPDLDSLRLRYGTWLWEAGELDDAERQATVLLTLDPDDPAAHSLLGLVEEARGRPQEALAHFRASLALEPTSVPLRAKVAETLMRTGDTTTARAMFDELLAEGALADSPEHLYRSAMLDAALGRFDRAEATFRQALALEPGGVHYLSFALVLLRQGKEAEAADSLRRSLASERLPLEPAQRAIAEQALTGLGG